MSDNKKVISLNDRFPGHASRPAARTEGEAEIENIPGSEVGINMDAVMNALDWYNRSGITFQGANGYFCHFDKDGIVLGYTGCRMEPGEVPRNFIEPRHLPAHLAGRIGTDGVSVSRELEIARRKLLDEDRARVNFDKPDPGK